jgi:spore maturation protein CgeB
MKILYVGDLWKGSTSLQRAHSLISLGHELTLIDSTSVKFNFIFQKIYNLTHKLKYPVDLIRLNSRLKQECNINKFDIVWIDKGLMIRPGTLLCLKKNVNYIINYSPDDMINPKNQSFFYLESIRLYDFHITTKSHNINELYSLGAKRVYYMMKGYDENLHKPILLPKNSIKKYYCEVGFIGTFEEDRLNHILFLCNNDIKVKVFGKTWKPLKKIHKNLVVDENDYFFTDYVEVINAIHINLCFLRKQNRDKHTQRSMEIPACGKLMLAERTEEHLNLFKEDEEAVYFDSGNYIELLNKVHFLLNNPKLVEDIGKNALRRCIKSNYSIKNVLNNFFVNVT